MVFTGQNMSPMLQNCLVDELEINIFFTNRSQTGIHFCWGRYLAITKAIEQAQITSKAGSWPSDLPAYNEVLIVDQPGITKRMLLLQLRRATPAW